MLQPNPSHLRIASHALIAAGIAAGLCGAVAPYLPSSTRTYSAVDLDAARSRIETARKARRSSAPGSDEQFDAVITTIRAGFDVDTPSTLASPIGEIEAARRTEKADGHTSTDVDRALVIAERSLSSNLAERDYPIATLYPLAHYASLALVALGLVLSLLASRIRHAERRRIAIEVACPPGRVHAGRLDDAVTLKVARLTEQTKAARTAAQQAPARASLRSTTNPPPPADARPVTKAQLAYAVASAQIPYDGGQISLHDDDDDDTHDAPPAFTPSRFVDSQAGQS